MAFSPQKMRANRLHLAHLDMEQAQNFLFAVSELERAPIFEDGDHVYHASTAIYIAAIVVYARSFVKSDSSGRAAPMLGIKGMFKGVPALRARHEHVLDLRQKAAAHADWEFHGTTLIHDGRTDDPLRSNWSPNFRKDLEPDQFWELVNHVNRQILHQLFDLDRLLVVSDDGPDIRIRRGRA